MRSAKRRREAFHGPAGISNMVRHIVAARDIDIAAELSYASGPPGLLKEIVAAGSKGKIYSAMDADVY